MFCFLCVLALLSVAGCESKASSTPSKTTTTKATATPTAKVSVAPTIRTRFPAPDRLVAIGDLHGDFEATKRVLKLAGLIDDSNNWSGGKTVLVQTGDVLDRGDGERAILDLLEKLQQRARTAGGAVHLLDGNHELMNVAGDFRYVTDGGFADFARGAAPTSNNPALARLPESQRARAAAFMPGGFYARKLASHPVVLVVGDSVFVHGGVLPKYARYGLEKINQEVAGWLLGISPAGSKLVTTPDSPVWSRHFSDEPDEQDCKLLDETLGVLKVARMVVGHTVQKTITSACHDKVWRIDVGMSSYYGGHVEALQIEGSTVKPLRSDEP